MLVEKLNALRAENDSEAGFTLIELMIVVVIISILAAVAIPVFLNQQKGAIAAGVKSDVKNTVTNISTALVKNPTAASITGSVTKTALPVTVGTVTTNAVVSDAATTLEVAGDWQKGYTVTGKNSGLTGSYVFDSSSGEYAGTDDLE